MRGRLKHISNIPYVIWKANAIMVSHHICSNWGWDYHLRGLY